MNIRSLTYFLTVAEELNITTAAQKLYITQQTLSSHIMRLEEQYGVILFERRPKLRLTPAGERMVHYATRIIRLERMMNTEFVDISKKSGGVLVVGCSRIRARYFLPQVYHTYQSLCPNVEIRMVEGNSKVFDDYIQSRKADICISLNSSDQRYIHKEPLLTESVYFLICPSLFAQYFGDGNEKKLKEFQHGISCGDILGIPLILQPPTNYIRQVLNWNFEALDVIPRTSFETNDSEMIFNMCLMGCGAALLPESVVFVPIGTGRQELRNLHIFPLRDVEISSVIAYPSDLELPRYEQVFVDVCKDVFSSIRPAMDHQKKIYFKR